MQNCKASQVGAHIGRWLRNFRSMTVQLEEAVKRGRALSQAEQDAVASQIIESLDDKEAWARRFREHPEILDSISREALAEHRRGETRPLDEPIG